MPLILVNNSISISYPILKVEKPYMTKYQVTMVLDIHAQLAECPTWSVKEQALYFVDILSNIIHRYEPNTGIHSTLTVHENIGCFGLREQGGFIAAMRSGIFLLDATGNIERQIAENPTGSENSRFNDGKVDPWGRFWCGTLWETDQQANSVFCYLDDNFKLHQVVENLTITNGLAFSPDKKWFYFTDTPHHVLYRQALDPNNGQPQGQKQIVKLFNKPNYQGQPDGATFDTQGCYWSAQFADSCIFRLSPSGELLAEIELPVKWPTMITFGGNDLKTLYITTSRENLSAEELNQYPQAGNIFSVKVDVAGIPTNLFRH